ncbi:TE: Gypsy retrotransposon integrase 1-like protein [Daphnia magna]|uniref:RNA-directed DNA polymerase n=1 Tax=Daphnia magna TaxID=35525 RepID=A0A164MQX8_9CRUS|nr:TE: Gypsy retrotransposon integrase 1-like protein [Daphnia magna]
MEIELGISQLTHPVVPVIGQHLFQPLRHQQQLEGAAMAAVRKFINPPIFRGSPKEDDQWLERYETISTHNGWVDADKRHSFSMYSHSNEEYSKNTKYFPIPYRESNTDLRRRNQRLYTSAFGIGVIVHRQLSNLFWDTVLVRNLFLCARLPNDWEDTAAQPAAGGNPVTPAIPDLRSVFLKEFQPDNYGLFQETRLRIRTQGVNEPTIRYYYEILNLCRLVDPNMSETHQLEHLFRGIQPTLFRKIYPLKPKTCEEFLALAKFYTEASLMSDTRGWKDTTAESQKPHEQLPNFFVVYIDQSSRYVGRKIGPPRNVRVEPESLKINQGSSKVWKSNCNSTDTGAVVAVIFPWTEDSSHKRPNPVTTEYGRYSSNPQGPNYKRKRNSYANVRRVIIYDKDIAACKNHFSPRRTIKKKPAGFKISSRNTSIHGSLLATTSLSTGHVLVQTDLKSIPVANLSPKSVWLEKGVTLGILEKHPEAKEMEETKKFLTIDASVDDQDSDAEKKELLKHLEERIRKKLTKEETYIEFVFPIQARLLPNPIPVAKTHSQPAVKSNFVFCMTWCVLLHTPALNVITHRLWAHVHVCASRFIMADHALQVPTYSSLRAVSHVPKFDRMNHHEWNSEIDLCFQILDIADVVLGTELCPMCRNYPDKYYLKFHTVVKHIINTANAPPIYRLPNKNAWKERAVIQNQVEGILRRGVIEPSDSSWSSPVVLVKKKDGTWRFCVEYRKLHAVTVKDSYPLPRIADTLSRLEGATFFSSMDLQSGYHQVSVVDTDRPETAFLTADGLYQFCTVPFGLTNAPGTFQRAMDIILAGLRWATCLIYLDDAIIYSATFQQNLERLRLVLSSLDQPGLKLKWSKCSFVDHTLKFKVSHEGHSTANRVKSVQCFLGLCSYSRRHIQDFASIARPLNTLTKKEIPFMRGEDQASTLASALKQALTSASVLVHPNYDLSMEIFLDACGYGIGGILAQCIEGAERPIAYASRLLTKSEVTYLITEKKCLALVWCLSKFRCFVWGCKVKVVTHHEALCWLMSKRDLAGRLARWSLSLQEYDITIVYRCGRTHGNADCLSRNPLPIAEELEDDRCFIVGVIPSPGLSEDEDEKLLKMEKNYRRLCVPVDYRERILQAYQDDVVSGHLGINRTLHKICDRFFWPKMELDKTSHVQSCVHCQSRKGIPDKLPGLLQCIKVESPFQKVGIGLLGPFPLSTKGNKMIIVAVDYLTKWVELKAMPTGKADDVAEFFVNPILLRHGAPEQIITDRGKYFTSDLTQAVVKKLHTNHKITSSYHFQENGAVERMNHTLAAMLSMYVSSDQRDWDRTLQYVTYASHTTRQDKSTGYSPFFLLYGCEPRLPIDLELDNDPNPLLIEEDAAMSYADRPHNNLMQELILNLRNTYPLKDVSVVCGRLQADLTEAKEIVKTRMERFKEKQKEAYGACYRELSFQAGDLVLVYKPFRKFGKSEKLLHRWLGPFRVLRQTTPVNYEVLSATDRGKSDIVRIARIKSFHEPTLEWQSPQTSISDNAETTAEKD